MKNAIITFCGIAVLPVACYVNKNSAMHAYIINFNQKQDYHKLHEYQE